MRIAWPGAERAARPGASPRAASAASASSASGGRGDLRDLRTDGPRDLPAHAADAPRSGSGASTSAWQPPGRPAGLRGPTPPGEPRARRSPPRLHPLSAPAPSRPLARPLADEHPRDDAEDDPYGIRPATVLLDVQRDHCGDRGKHRHVVVEQVAGHPPGQTTATACCATGQSRSRTRRHASSAPARTTPARLCPYPAALGRITYHRGARPRRSGLPECGRRAQCLPSLQGNTRRVCGVGRSRG